MGFNGERPPIPEEFRGEPPEKPNEQPTVPENEIDLEFVRSSGPGGQNVNKTSSKAQLRWNVGASQAFTEEQKAAIRAGAGNRLNKEDEIVLSAQTERSQSQNRDEVVERLQDLVAEALTPEKERRPTKVSKSQRQERLDDKRRTSDKKGGRKPPQGDW
jgi:ribosome-associated protein